MLARRKFLLFGGRFLGAGALVALAWRLGFSTSNNASREVKLRRCGWQINLDKCDFCGKCSVGCVQKPSAIKALNDQKKCSSGIVCYGYITDKNIPSEQIQHCANLVCPERAVVRTPFSGGASGNFLYTIDQNRCTGCARCVLPCHDLCAQSMFLAIRPDLCLQCNDCTAARDCPHQAIERVPLAELVEARHNYPFRGEEIEVDEEVDEYE